MLLDVSPSVVRTRTVIRYQLPATGRTSLRVLDIAGRVVRDLPVGVGRSGVTAWDCRDDAGRAVAPGIYFVRLAAPDSELQAKVVLTR